MKKVGNCGFGGQGAWHAKKIIANNVVAVGGIYDVNPSRMEKGKEMGFVAFESYEAMLKSDCDIILVATPNDVHADLCIKALNAGKHVICEKPVTLSIAEFDAITAAAKANGKIFEVHQNRRWDTDFLALKALIESEKIGKPLYIGSAVQGSRGIPGDWRTQKEYGGGMVYDWGVHMIDQMLQLIKSPIKSLYCMETHYTNSEVDDGYRLYLHFENGVLGYSEVGTYNFISESRFYAQFEQGTARIAGWHDPVLVKECFNWGEGEVHPVQTASGITRTMAPRTDATVNEYQIEQPTSDAHDFYRNLVDAIDGKAEKLILDKEVRRVLQVIDAAFESARTNSVVTFDQPI